MDWINRIPWQYFMIELTAAILMTTFTGTISVLCCMLFGKRFRQWGYANVYYWILKLSLLIFAVPVPFFIILFLEHKYRLWGGYLFQRTEVILRICTIFNIFWSIGFVVMLVLQGIQLVKVHRFGKHCVVCKKEIQDVFEHVCQSMNIKFEKVQLLQGYKIIIPEIFGVLKPTIMLPMETYSENELKVIFTHELTHYKQRDVWVKYGAMLVRAIHFFNPLLWILHREICQWSEFVCDARACRQWSNPKEYFGVILKIAKDIGRMRMNFSSGLVEEKPMLMKRVEYMKLCRGLKKKTTGKAVALSILLTLTYSLATFAGVKGGVDSYQGMYDATVVSIEETAVPIAVQKELTDNGTASNVDVIVMPTEGHTRSNASFSWTVESRQMAVTGLIYLSKGQTINVLVTGDLTISAGIVDSSGNRRYVNGTSIMHPFAITTSGYYSVFVENKNSVSVNVSGASSVN